MYILHIPLYVEKALTRLARIYLLQFY